MTTRTVMLGDREVIVLSDNKGEGTVSISAHIGGNHSTVDMTRDQWAEVQLNAQFLFGPELKKEGELPPIAFGVTTNKDRPDSVTLSISAPELSHMVAWDLNREQWADIKRAIDTHFNKREKTNG